MLRFINSNNLFEAKIEEYASKKSSYTFENTGLDDALIFIKAIFKYAKSIKMLCNGLGSKLALHPEYISSLRDFLNKPNSSLSVIVISQEYFKCDAMKLIIEKTQEDAQRFKIFHASELTQCKNGPHLMIGDNRIFRLEVDSKKYTAYGSFNNPDLVEKLENYASIIISKAKPIGPKKRIISPVDYTSFTLLECCL